MTIVAVLMATYNGAEFLPAQLDSIAAQTVNWRLLVSDDGSRDATTAIVDDFAARHPGLVSWHQGPRKGPGWNFRAMLRHIPDEADLAGFSDQDDIWLPAKLARAVAALAEVAPGTPALYCGRTQIVTDDLRPLGLSRQLRRPAGFANALVQNIAGGNTMVMNRAAWQLLRAANDEAGEVAIHDWWVYQLVTGAGGQVIFDDEPGLLYRQHDQNAIGANAGFMAALSRARMLAQGRFARWNRMNAAALRQSAHRLTEANRARLTDFETALAAPGAARRLRALWRSGAYRQSVQSNIALWVAAVLNRL